MADFIGSMPDTYRRPPPSGSTELRCSPSVSPQRRSFRLRLGSDRLGSQPDSHRGDDTQDGWEFGVAILAERLVKPLLGHAGGLCNLTHAPSISTGYESLAAPVAE